MNLQRLARIADDVADSPGDHNLPADKTWICSELEQFPLRYAAYGTSPRRIAAHLGAIRRLQEAAWSWRRSSMLRWEHANMP